MHLTAPPLAEIHIDVGHRDALGIEKALEEQIVFHRVHVGDAQRITYQAAGGRPTARSDRDYLRPGIADKIPHDQEVALVAHLGDHLDLGGKPLLVFREGVPQPARLKERLENGNPLVETLTNDPLEISVERIALGYFEIGERVSQRINADITPLCDRCCPDPNASGSSPNTCAISCAVLK